MPETLRYIAPAKINLGLEILRRRPDGYHELRTIFYRVLEPHDSMEVTPSENFRFTCTDESLPVDDRNLVMRAARLFSESTGLDLPPIHVHLEKRIPAQAGLGGGSSDAATMIRILKDVNSHSLKGHEDTARQPVNGSRIGADVPFFLSESRAALATGIGDILTPIELELSSSILIVVDPTIHVSTREAYDGLDPSSFLRSELSVLPRLEKGGGVRNDFESSIFARHPRLGIIKGSMYERGAYFALMTGSGSAVYGLFHNTEEALSACRDFMYEGLQAFLS